MENNIHDEEPMQIEEQPTEATETEQDVHEVSFDNNAHSNVENDKEVETSEKGVNLNDSNAEDCDQACPICMDQWTSSGDHRLCCLRCGHLFGHSCILKWLQCSCNSTNRRCPQCNKKASVKHIRFLYARKLSSKDTGELEKMKKDLHNVTAEKEQIQIELAQCNVRLKVYEQTLTSFKSRITELESQQSVVNIYKSQNASGSSTKKFHLERSIDICKDSECRVLDYNPWYNILVVSQKTKNALLNGYGVRKINPENFQMRQFIFLHNQAIRDVTFHSTQPTLLLSVGFDKCVKLMDIQNNMIVHTYKTENPLWSCCWSGDNSNFLLVGAQNGSISRFDIRHISGSVDTLNGFGDRSPVASLATVPPNPDSGISKGGFIACHLNTCCAYEAKNPDYLAKQIFLEGPFISVRYDKKTNHALISSRPSVRQPHARHAVCTIEKGSDEVIMCSVVHTFHAGNSQKLLSRPCYIHTDNDTLVAAHQEMSSSIALWSITSGKQLQIIPVSDPVMDLCSFTFQNELLLASLSTKKLKLYSCGQTE